MIKLGKYKISEFDKNIIWVMDESGRSIHFSKEKLAVLFDKWYQENF